MKEAGSHLEEDENDQHGTCYTQTGDIAEIEGLGEEIAGRLAERGSDDLHDPEGHGYFGYLVDRFGAGFGSGAYWSD